MSKGPRNLEPERQASDAELARRAAGGDEGAFAELVRLKRERVFWIVQRIVGNQEDAREIAQATFVRLWKSLSKYRPDQGFDTWLYTIAANLAIDHYRVHGTARAVPLEDVAEPAADERTAPSLAGDPLAALAGAEMGRIFDRLAARLGEKQRAVFVLSQIEGVPTEQIARMLGITASTVRNHLQQARRTLQQGLRESYPEYFPKPGGGQEK